MSASYQARAGRSGVAGVLATPATQVGLKTGFGQGLSVSRHGTGVVSQLMADVAGSSGVRKDLGEPL
jgi:hypothetical protein